MENKSSLEVWMRGPIEGVPDLLQPTAHALLQVGEDIERYTKNLSNEHIWVKPYGLANLAFHLQHITGVIDRMFTYADKRSLSEDQFTFLANEGVFHADISLKHLIKNLQAKIDESINFLRKVNQNNLDEVRYLGRERIPTTQIGLLFHAAEHSQRHLGQLLVTARCLERTT